MVSRKSLKAICDSLFVPEFAVKWSAISKSWERGGFVEISPTEKGIFTAALAKLNEQNFNLNSSNLLIRKELQYYKVISLPFLYSKIEHIFVGTVNKRNAKNWPIELSCTFCLSTDLEELCHTLGYGRLEESIFKEELPSLTKRESQVLELIAKGHTQKRMADLLDISISTIETYKQRIFKKFDVRSSIELVNKYNVRGK